MTDPTGRPPHSDRLDDLVDELADLVGDEDLARRVLQELRQEMLAAPHPEVAEQHLAAMRQAAAESATPEVIDLRGARKVRRVITGTVVGLVALGSTGGLAAAGMLPAPIQDALSRAASVIAIDLPRADSGPPSTVPPATLADIPGTSGEVPGATAPGRTGEVPGDTAPGRTGEVPGATAPGRTGEVPGDTAPGRGDEPPGPPAENPGATAPGQAEEPPGPPAETPGDTAPGRGTTPPTPPVEVPPRGGPQAPSD